MAFYEGKLPYLHSVAIAIKEKNDPFQLMHISFAFWILQYTSYLVSFRFDVKMLNICLY